MTLIEIELGVIALCLLTIASRPIRSSPPSLWRTEQILAEIRDHLRMKVPAAVFKENGPFIVHSTGVYGPTIGRRNG